MDHDYVREILASIRPGLSGDQFSARCQSDVNAGYAEEVAEAARIYFEREVAMEQRLGKDDNDRTLESSAP